MNPHTKLKICLILMAVILVFAIFDGTTTTVNASPRQKRKPFVVETIWIEGGHQALVTWVERERAVGTSVAISTIHHPACPCGHASK